MATAAVFFSSSQYAHAQRSAPYFKGDSISIDATINRKPAHLLLDTGSSFTALFKSGAERLGIDAVATGQVNIAGEQVDVSHSPDIELTMFGNNATTRLRILPFTHSFDGVLGWRSVQGKLLIDGYDRQIGPVERLPSKSGWQIFPIEKENSQLFIHLSENGKPVGRVFVDTGVEFGLRLSPALWQAWKVANPDQRTTLETFRYAVGEEMSNEIAWADRYRLGDVVFHQLDIGPLPAPPSATAEAARTPLDVNGHEYIATIGMRALRHLHMLIDQQKSEIWLKSISGIPDHNRLGVIFLPRSDSDPTPICRVAPNTPASEAGILTGDALVRFGEKQFEGHKTGQLGGIEKQLSQPPGTIVKIRVQRGDQTLDFDIALRDLLP